jgi:hypothetical protein
MRRIFVDANVINDIFDANRPLHDASFVCLQTCLQQNVTLVTSCDLVTTIYYVTSKTQGRAKALQALEHIQTIFEIAPFGNRELAVAVQLMQTDQDYKDLEDTIQYILAKNNGCELILTNDAKFVAKDLQIINSQDAVTHFTTG